MEFAAEQHAEHVKWQMMDSHKNCLPTPISFKNLFLAQEEDDDESASLADVLAVLAEKYPGGTPFQAADVGKIINASGDWVDGRWIEITDEARESRATLRDFLFPDASEKESVSAKATGRRLKKHVGEPVNRGGNTLVLKTMPNSHTKALDFKISVLSPSAACGFAA